VLALYKAERDAFTNDHLRVMLAIASKVGICIENALKYQQAESSATTDYLTGLPNARSLFLHLDRELARCKRSHTPLAVMVCDLDGFKQINDRFGHLEGNKVLRIFADFMKAVCREYDYVARMGGDEFVIVAPGMTQQAAEDKGAHLLSLAREAGRQVSGQDFLSVSIGCAFYPEAGSDAEQLLTEADRRMYSVKQVQHERAARMRADSDSPAVVN
jgi:diguanylate cyclase (GGDEF)-like protein